MNHEFEAMITVKLRYDCTPLDRKKTITITKEKAEPGQKPGTFYPFWVPSIAVSNARDLSEVDHSPDGEDDDDDDIPGFEEFPTTPQIRTVTKHYEANFIKSLDLHRYPFDSQELEIIIIGDRKSVLTHMMDRQDKNAELVVKLPERRQSYFFSNRVSTPSTLHVKKGDPLLLFDEDETHHQHHAPKRYVRAKIDDDVLSEWEVSVWKEFKHAATEFGEPVPVVCDYVFKEEPKKHYTKMLVKIYVVRRWRPIFMASIMPMMMLSCSSMVVYCMEITANQGNRFSALFTIVLTIVANTIILDGNLPKLPYETWVDSLLLQLTLFVYWIIAESGAVVAIAYGTQGGGNVAAADYYDNVAWWISLAVFCMISITSTISASRLLRLRRREQDDLEDEARFSLVKEEKRLKALSELCPKLGIEVGNWYASQSLKTVEIFDAGRGEDTLEVQVKADSEQS